MGDKKSVVNLTVRPFQIIRLFSRVALEIVLALFQCHHMCLVVDLCSFLLPAQTQCAVVQERQVAGQRKNVIFFSQYPEFDALVN